MLKDYKSNSKLKEYLESKISQMKVDSEYKPILVDILMRRAYEFELSQEEFEQDVNSLVTSLETIEVKTIPKTSNVLGLYDGFSKKIVIDRNHAQTATDIDLFQTFTHEVYHALTHTNGEDNKLRSINSITQEENVSLEEISIERASRRTTLNPSSPTESEGYEYILFIGDCIEQVYGVSDTEFLKRAMRDRNELIQFLSNTIGEQDYETQDFLDSLEANVATLHNIFYPQNPNKPLRTKQATQMVKDAMSGIYRICFEKFKDRIELMIANAYTMDDVQSSYDNQVFNYDRLRAHLGDYAEFLSEYYHDESIKNDILDRGEASKFDVMKRLSCLGKVLEKKDEIQEFEDVQKYTFWATSGGQLSYMCTQEDLDRLGIVPEEIPIEIYPKTEDYSEEYDEDYNGETDEDYVYNFEIDEWDNSEIISNFRNIAVSKVKLSRAEKITESIKKATKPVVEPIGKFAKAYAKRVIRNFEKGLQIFFPKFKLLEKGKQEDNFTEPIIIEMPEEQEEAPFGSLSPEELESFNKASQAEVKKAEGSKEKSNEDGRNEIFE